MQLFLYFYLAIVINLVGGKIKDKKPNLALFDMLGFYVFKYFPYIERKLPPTDPQ